MRRFNTNTSYTTLKTFGFDIDVHVWKLPLSPTAAQSKRLEVWRQPLFVLRSIGFNNITNETFVGKPVMFILVNHEDKQLVINCHRHDPASSFVFVFLNSNVALWHCQFLGISQVLGRIIAFTFRT